MSRFCRIIRHPWLLPISSGVLVGTSYIPFPPWAALFCFVPLWLFWQQQTTLKPVLLGGLLTAFLFTLIGFNWVALTLHEFAHLDWPWAIVGLLLYASATNLFVPVAGGLWFCLQRRLGFRPDKTLAVMALLTVLCQANSFTLFDWNFGYSWLSAGLPIYQWAEIIGFSGLSAVTILANLPLTWAWQQRRWRSGGFWLAGVLAGFTLFNLGGIGLKNRLPSPDSSVTVLLVQASISSQEKLAAELGRGRQAETFRRYAELTAEALRAHPQRKIDFALWPETAYPYLLGEDFVHWPSSQVLAQFLSQWQLPLLTGAYSVVPHTKLLTNSLFVLDANGQLVPPHYSKTHLLAFGEFIPGEETFPFIRDWLPKTGRFQRGDGPRQLLELNGLKMGAQICYESLFPDFSRALADLGAQFIVNVTNDSWYGTWQEPYQHLYMTLARGVEFRRPVLRVTNSGISTVGLASGEVLSFSPIAQPWAGIYTVPYLRQPVATFYQKYPWLMPAILWGALAMLCLAPLRRQS